MKSAWVAVLLVSGLLPLSAGAQPPACPVPQAGPGTFTIFWITDTQYLSEYQPALFTGVTQWIAQNYAACNGKMVVHTGDIVNDWNVPQEWANANASMSVLLSAGIPYTWDAGNHDFNGTYIGSEYRAFNASYVSGAESQQWAGSSPDGMSTAVSFAFGGQTYLIVNIEFDGTAELQWAAGILASHQGSHAIVATHAYIDQCGSTDGSVPPCQSSWAQQMQGFVAGLNSVMSAHPGVFMTLNGHYYNGEYHGLDPAGARWNLMFNWQDAESMEGAARVTTLTFDPARNRVYGEVFDLTQAPSLVDQYHLALATVSVKCGASALLIGSRMACTSLVGSMLGTAPLNGTVEWGQSGPGGVAFSPPTCAPVAGACRVNATGASLGEDSITATYDGAATFRAPVEVNSVSVTCAPTTVGTATTCRVAVYGSAPTGLVLWSSDSGKLKRAACKLQGGACEVSFVPLTISPARITASYVGDSNNPHSAASISFATMNWADRRVARVLWF